MSSTVQIWGLKPKSLFCFTIFGYWICLSLQIWIRGSAIFVDLDTDLQGEKYSITKNYKKKTQLLGLKPIIFSSALDPFWLPGLGSEIFLIKLSNLRRVNLSRFSKKSVNLDLDLDPDPKSRNEMPKHCFFYTMYGNIFKYIWSKFWFIILKILLSKSLSKPKTKNFLV